MAVVWFSHLGETPIKGLEKRRSREKRYTKSFQTLKIVTPDSRI